VLAVSPTGYAASEASAPEDNAVYVFARAEVANKDEFRRYQDAFLRSVTAYGGEIILDIDIGLDPPDPGRRVDFTEAYINEVKFPSLDSSARWYSSPAYQQLIPMRKRAVTAFRLTFSVERYDVVPR